MHLAWILCIEWFCHEIVEGRDYKVHIANFILLDLLYRDVCKFVKCNCVQRPSSRL